MSYSAETSMIFIIISGPGGSVVIDVLFDLVLFGHSFRWAVIVAFPRGLNLLFCR